MSAPRFSIVVPTRERPRTLASSLKTCLAQTFDDYEVVVCDNASSPATRAVVDGLADERLRYVRSGVPLAMSASWELALSHARGEWVLFIGDDDGILPFALAELDRLARVHPCQAVKWDPAAYYWPEVRLGAPSSLILHLDRTITRRRTVDRVRELIERFDSTLGLPMIYHGMFHRDLIARARQELGKVFLGRFPDTASFALGHLAGEYLSTSLPMTIAGFSERSNNIAFLEDAAGDAVADEFDQLSGQQGYGLHPWVCPLRVVPTVLVDSFLVVKERLFPDDDSLRVDREHIVRLTVEEVMRLAGERKREASLRVLRSHLAADRPDLLGWFDALCAATPPGRPLDLRPECAGYAGDALFLDASELGARDVAGVAALCAKLLRFRPGETGYDVEPRSAAAKRALLAEQRCRELERAHTASPAPAPEARREGDPGRARSSPRAVLLEPDVDELHARRLDALTVDALRAVGADPVGYVDELFARHEEAGQRRAAAAALRAALRLDRPAEREAVDARLLGGRLGLVRPGAARPDLERLLTSSRRKVVHVNGWWGVGGTERHIAALLSGTADEHDTVLVTHEMPAGAFGFQLHPSVVRLEVRSGAHWLLPVATLAIGLAADLTVVHPMYVLGLPRVFERLARAGVRTIAAHYSSYYVAAILPQLYPLHMSEWPAVWRSADAVVWIGRSSAALCATSCGRTYHAPAMVEAVPDPGERSRGVPPRLLAVGRHYDAFKRADHILGVFERIVRRHPTARLTFVGPFSLELRAETGGPSMAELLDRLGPARGQVELVGTAPDVEPYFRAADLFLHASESEGTPLVFLEAGLHRVPVVAAEFLDVGDLLTDGVNGRVTAQGDLDAMARAASELLDDDGARRAMGERAREKALRFRPEVVAPRWRRIFDAVLEHGREAGRFAGEDLVTPAVLEPDRARRAVLEADRSMARLMGEVSARGRRLEELHVELVRALTRPLPGLYGVVDDTIKSLREDGLRTTQERIVSRLAKLVARRRRGHGSPASAP